MNKSKKQTWFWLILILIILIALYFVFDKFSKEGLKNGLEQSCITNNGDKECVPTANKCESLPDGSYNCSKTKKNNKKQKQE
jgi:hypothetical protein